MLQRSEEATALRKEVVALRYETANQRSSMVTTMKDIATSLLVSRLLVRHDQLLHKLDLRELSSSEKRVFRTS